MVKFTSNNVFETLLIIWLFLFKNNKIILTFVAVFVIFISYLLLPTFYKQSDISKVLNTELQKKFDLNFKFSKNIKYNFFPKPHFIIKNSKILNNEKEISKISKLKIFISFDNLFSLKNISVKNLILEKINSFFGYDAIQNLKLVSFEEKNEEFKEKTSSNDVTKNKYKKQISDIKNDKIKN